ncbi:MAG: S-adenosylmethionine:tRNA ribosyltransferase-isomerase, partial [Phycisphaerales bacterium]
MLKTSELEYDLPEELLATHAAEPRDAARLMVVPRAQTSRLQHRVVSELPGLLRPGDLLVLNVTRVVPARLIGVREDTGGRIEGLYLGTESQYVDGPTASRGMDEVATSWVVMLQGKRLKPGVVVKLASCDGRPGPGGHSVLLELQRKWEAEPGAWVVQVKCTSGNQPDLTTKQLLEVVGATPLPPYIVRARKNHGEAADEGADRARYQTVFAGGIPEAEQVGSVAAPTAGLHITSGVLAGLKNKGVEIAEVVLQVGSGTFRSVETEHVEEHPIHREWCSMSDAAIAAVRAARARGGRVIALGTTACRTLETFGPRAEAGEAVGGSWIDTRLLITPGYRWTWVDGLFT